NPNSSFLLTHLLTGMFDKSLNSYTSVTGSTISDQLTRTYAGKSGTTTYDSWMIGYSPTIVTGVWTGYDDNRSMESTAENSFAKNIWARFMEAAHKGEPVEDFTPPPSVEKLEIDPTSGKIATPYCPSSRTMYFKKGTEPTTHCTHHFPGAKENDDENLEKPEKEKGVLQRIFEWFM